VHVPILSARTGWHTDELLRALAARGHTGRVVPYEALVARLGTGRAAAAGGLTADGESLDRADAVLARIIPNGSLEQLIYRVDALHWLEERGVRVVNGPRCIERCVDKFYTSALLQGAGLPTPETVVCERLDAAMEAVRVMGDVIVKPIFGSMGHGMVRVSDPDTAFRVLRALDAVRAVFYVQRVVEHGGRDVRAFVVGGRVLGAIERRAPDGGWRTNVSLGGEPARPRAAARVGAPRARRRARRRRRLRGRRPPPGARRHHLRARGQRRPGVGGAAARHRARRRGRGRRRAAAPCGGRRPRRCGRDRVTAPPAAAGALDVATAAQLACLLEASAPKPGNVSPGRHFRDARYEDFLASAAAVGPALAGAGARPLGVTVRRAVEATARWTRSNTNLGIVLLLAPLARAADAAGAPLGAAALRARVRAVVAATTADDAREVYAPSGSPRRAGWAAPTRRTWPPSRR
jgi:RimK family alpha-L-glutamate ligase